MKTGIITLLMWIALLSPLRAEEGSPDEREEGGQPCPRIEGHQHRQPEPRPHRPSKRSRL